MEPPVVRSRGRPRKRKRNDLQNADNEKKSAPDLKKKALETRPMALVGQFILKEFKGSGNFLGKVVYYEDGLYRVVYEDGDSEDLESGEIRVLLIDDRYFDDDLNNRKDVLDEFALKSSVKGTNGSDKKVVKSIKGVDRVDTSIVSELRIERMIENDTGQAEVDADSSSDSCEYVEDRDNGSGYEAETQLFPPPNLPPSSGTIGVPEEYVSHLLSVYGFLRSFSIQLFLFPFSLDDFVGSLNCYVSNTLLDAIHVALMRILRRHLETLSSDGLEVASKCLRCIDWRLLDTLTWPVYLVRYLTVMGYAKGWEWSEFFEKVLDGEYCSLPAGRKLMVLQIICDDVLESTELRAEIDLREESEFGMNDDVGETNHFENGPKRVHPRYSKTSACKDAEAMEIIAENHGRKPSSNSSILDFGSAKGDTEVTNIDTNRNSDECRLCGMDGILLCCDGCPSAYHSRCIGVMKMFIPEGLWYCPECSISKMGPAITRGTSLRGSEIFGIDAHEQIFLASCDHLLVLKASINTEPCVRYFNRNDIPKVLQVLYLSAQHASLYSGICKSIISYWNIPESLLSLPGTIGKYLCPSYSQKDTKLAALQVSSGEEDHKVLDMVEDGKNVTDINERNEDNVAVSCVAISSNQVSPMDQPGHHTNTMDCMHMNVQPESIKVLSAVSNSSVSQLTDPSDLIQGVADRSTAVDFARCTSRSSNASCNGHGTDMCFPENLSSQRKEGNLLGQGTGDMNSADCLYMGSMYKPQAYVNYYTHGDFAASAAAKLAVLSAEETRVSDVQASDNMRKVSSAYNSLQAKAFSLTASRFFWPTSEKKLMEVPRERCGWCLSCKASVSSKRGCMLNHAALSATKGAMRILAGLLPMKNGEGSLRSIVTYILFMEASLSSLVVGPFLCASYRKQWRRQVEQASTCSAIKTLLLELEKNIRVIAFSSDWFKLVDDEISDSSIVLTTTCPVGTSQKRAPSGRRNRKQSVLSEASDKCHDGTFYWWPGKLSKYVFRRAVLPQSIVRRAACEGGVRKISGLHYADGSEIPKRSRQLVWRVAVEMSKNASQLAFQVRDLDFHLRWSELVRPEQILQEAKGPESEASAFRNAIIFNKKVVDNKVTYGVTFGNQKHLPSRVMKNVLEVDDSEDGKLKYWFSETRVPLYLVKEYEESLNKALSSAAKPLNLSMKSQGQWMKSFRRDIFFYLICRRDNMGLCTCSSCQMDIMIGNAEQCSECKGYCHEHCTVRPQLSSFEDAGFPIMCKQCSHPKTLTESPTSPLPSQGQEYRSLVTVSRDTKPNRVNQPLVSVKTQDTCSETKQATSDSGLATKSRSKIRSWGIIWRKKNCEDSGINFRLNYILLRGCSGLHHVEPICLLCSKPYRSDMLYICCETCKHWYHAEAVELDESKIVEVVGFKCCKCRRIKSPECPYTDPKDKRQESKKLRVRASKQESLPRHTDAGTISSSKKSESNALMFPREVSRQDDPLLFSLAKVELVTDHNSDIDVNWNTASVPGPQKLPVRRQGKREDVDGFSGDSLSQIVSSTPLETNDFLEPTEKSCFTHEDWNTSIDGLDGDVEFNYEGFNYEDMDFEPQTYFSFTELLAPDDGFELDGAGASHDVLANWDNTVSVFSEDDISKQRGVGSFNDQLKPTISALTVNCQICSEIEPVPDLSCKNCGISIHCQCSPWGDSIPWEDNWSCGSCREWR